LSCAAKPVRREALRLWLAVCLFILALTGIAINAILFIIRS
jgi:hypothetical protein